MPRDLCLPTGPHLLISYSTINASMDNQHSYNPFSSPGPTSEHGFIAEEAMTLQEDLPFNHCSYLMTDLYASLSCWIVAAGRMTTTTNSASCHHSIQSQTQHRADSQLLSFSEIMLQKLSIMMDLTELGFILLPLCTHVIWHVRILIHLVYDCSSNITEARIKYRPIQPNNRQVQPSLTNEILSFIIHIKSTASQISEPILPDLKLAYCQHSFIQPNQ